MSAIVTLGGKDIWLTYSWSNNNHGICGHTYEVIDYYHILNKHMDVGIVLCEDIDRDMFKAAIEAKYDFTEEEVEDILWNTRFFKRPKMIRAEKILFTDGGIVNMNNVTLLCDKIYYMACGNREVKDNDKDNVYILQDDRVYEPVKKNGIHYVKKILFDRIKKPEKTDNRVLVYGTKNCRNVDDYKPLQKYGNLLIVTNEENRPKGLVSVVPPIDNLFEQFNTYLYTPIARKWDCSPRFLAECKYFDKEVIFHDIDYWDEDHGLRVRWDDIQNNFESLYLTDDDPLIKILND